MNLARLAKQTEKMITDNAPVILTAVGVAGTLTTAYLTARASFKAAEIIMDEDPVFDFTSPIPPWDTKARIKRVWKLYIPPVAVAAVTCTSIICANRVGTRRAAAMASAFTISEKAFTEYREKVVDQIGKNKEQKVRDEVAQDTINANPVSKQQIIITGGGESLCYDKYTGRYFQSSMEAMKKAQNDLNYQLLHEGYASLNEFYSKLGLNHIPAGDDLGWNAENEQMEISFTTTMSEDDRPCLVMDFYVAPAGNFFRTH